MEPIDEEAGVLGDLEDVSESEQTQESVDHMEEVLRIKLKCGLVCELTLRVNRHSNGQESPLSHHFVF